VAGEARTSFLTPAQSSTERPIAYKKRASVFRYCQPVHIDVTQEALEDLLYRQKGQRTIGIVEQPGGETFVLVLLATGFNEHSHWPTIHE
jgi:hypothetical protein